MELYRKRSRKRNTVLIPPVSMTTSDGDRARAFSQNFNRIQGPFLKLAMPRDLGVKQDGDCSEQKHSRNRRHRSVNMATVQKWLLSPWSYKWFRTGPKIQVGFSFPSNNSGPFSNRPIKLFLVHGRTSFLLSVMQDLLNPTAACFPVLIATEVLIPVKIRYSYSTDSLSSVN